jgi:hypothetical protein
MPRRKELAGLVVLVVAFGLAGASDRHEAEHVVVPPLHTTGGAR